MMQARKCQNPPPRSRIQTAGFLGAIVGPKDLETPAHFNIKPKAHAEEKEVPKDE